MASINSQMVEIELWVNGEHLRAQVAKDQSLMAFLREDLRLTGTKNGCGNGHCGACTVLLDDLAVRSCKVKVINAEGKRVITIEGLAEGGILHPVQQAFLDEGALQCGYCTPGMIMSTVALLNKNSDPSESEIRRALSANLCRCTGYGRIIRAVKGAAEVMRGGSAKNFYQPFSLEKPATYIGQNLNPEDNLSKVTGEIKFAGDLHYHGMLWGYALRTKYPHAEILGIDTDAAEKLPGVEAVLTAKDIPGHNGFGMITYDQPVLCGDKVRYVGDAVAVIAAVDQETCQEAAKLIKVDYRELPGIFSAEQALAPGAEHIHPGGNLMTEVVIKKGDANSAFDEAWAVVENTYETPFVEHAFLEPEAAVAAPANDGSITVYMGSQDPFGDAKQIANTLGVELEKVRVVHMPTGGSFGGKHDVTVQIHAALLCWKTGKSVKMVFSREESMLVHPKRHPFKIKYKSAVDNNGKLLAVQVRAVSDKGAYSSLSLPTLKHAAVHSTGPYEVANVDIEIKGVYTNNPPATAMRGFGVPQFAFALEAQMDALAEKLGMDPFEIRLHNALKEGSVLASGQRLTSSVGAKETILAAQEVLNRLSLPPGAAVGVACGFKNVGHGHGNLEAVKACLEVEQQGQLAIKVGSCELGQGFATIMRQIAAEETGIDPAVFKVITGDTKVTPPAGATNASRQTFITGNAVRLAAASMKEKLTEAAAKFLGINSAEMEFSNGRFLSRGDPSVGIDLDEVLIQISKDENRFFAEAQYNPLPTTPLTEESITSESAVTHIAYSFATHVAIVAKDAKGRIRVQKVIAAHDVGRAINPALVEAQIEGGVVMGVGFALSEKLELERGFIKNLNLNTYKIPTFKDAPEIIPVIVESQHPDGPYGAKGVGELATVPTGAAIANAVFNLTGHRVTELPIKEIGQ